MFRKVVLFLVFIILGGALVACGSNPSAGGSPSVEGTSWVASTVNIDGSEYSKDDLPEVYVGYTYTFEKDGVAIITVLEQTSQATYSQKDSEVKINNAGQEYVGVINGNNMTMESMGVKIVFTKK